MKIHASLKVIGIADGVLLQAGGPGSGRHPGGAVADHRYNPEMHAQLHQQLLSNGYAMNSGNRDASKGMVSYAKTIHDPERGVSTTHGVHVMPDGSWTHTITDSIHGNKVDHLMRTLRKSEALSAARIKRKKLFV